MKSAWILAALVVGVAVGVAVGGRACRPTPAAGPPLVERVTIVPQGTPDGDGFGPTGLDVFGVHRTSPSGASSRPRPWDVSRRGWVVVLTYDDGSTDTLTATRRP